jgi:hypothetical protein
LIDYLLIRIIVQIVIPIETKVIFAGPWRKGNNFKTLNQGENGDGKAQPTIRLQTNFALFLLIMTNYYKQNNVF